MIKPHLHTHKEAQRDTGVWGREESAQLLSDPSQESHPPIKAVMKMHLQNYGMVAVRGDHWRSPSLTPLFKQGHPVPIAQDPVLMAFE